MVTNEMVEAAAKLLYRTVNERMAYGVRKQVRLALEAAERAGWQPIETAPKRPEGNDWHGPSILLANRDNVDIGYWFTADHSRGPGWEWDWTTQPTHWRPLPEPPPTTEGT